MNLRISQWAAIIALDLLMRCAYFAALDGVAGLRFAPYPSVGHLALLFTINYAVALLGPRMRGATFIVLVLTNVLFVATYAYVSLTFLSGETRGCVAWACGWIERLEDTVQTTEAQVAINLVPVLLVLAVMRWRAAPRDHESREMVGHFLLRPLVPLRAWQWLLLITLDVALRHALFAPVPVLGLVLTLPVSIAHLTLLALINHADLGWRRLDDRSALFLLLFIANMLFAFGVATIGLGMGGGCVGYTCYWIDGVITPAGIRRAFSDTVIQVAFNVTCVLLVYALGNLRKPKS